MPVGFSTPGHLDAIQVRKPAGGPFRAAPHRAEHLLREYKAVEARPKLSELETAPEELERGPELENGKAVVRVEVRTWTEGEGQEEVRMSIEVETGGLVQESESVMLYYDLGVGPRGIHTSPKVWKREETQNSVPHATLPYPETGNSSLPSFVVATFQSSVAQTDPPAEV